jgi:hypothetical protein
MNVLQTAIESMRGSGLRYHDIARLAWLKYRIWTGPRREIPIEYKRLTFIRYLFEHGRLQS